MPGTRMLRSDSAEATATRWRSAGRDGAPGLAGGSAASAAVRASCRM